MLGKVQTGKIIDENERAYYVQVHGLSFELKKTELTQEKRPRRGDTVSGFAYENKQGRREMTQFLPVSGESLYGWGKVKESRSGLGVFVDIGLPNKDVVCSLDDLPLSRQRWPQAGDRLLVKIVTDDKDRMWAHPASENIFEQLAVKFPAGMMNKNVTATVYAAKSIGCFALTDDYYLAFVHSSQMQRPLRLGQQIHARVVGVSRYGRLNLSVMPRAFEEIGPDAQMLLMSLRRKRDKSLTFSDKSDPAAIKQYFGISKSAFKRALGRLLKNGYVREDKDQGRIVLVNDPQG